MRQRQATPTRGGEQHQLVNCTIKEIVATCQSGLAADWDTGVCLQNFDGENMKFNLPKGQRFHKQFCGITTFHPMWWMHDSRRWVQAHEIPNAPQECYGTHAPCRSIRAFRRHLRKHPEIIGKAVLVSRFVGGDVYA